MTIEFTYEEICAYLAAWGYTIKEREMEFSRSVYHNAPLVPHKVKVALVEATVKSELLKVKGAWARELQIVGRLTARYPDPEFWSGFSLGFQCNSCAFLLTDKGAMLLGDAFRLYTFHKTQQQISLDTGDKRETFVVDIEEPPVAKPKRDALSWADSTTTQQQ